MMYEHKEVWEPTGPGEWWRRCGRYPRIVTVFHANGSGLMWTWLGGEPHRTGRKEGVTWTGPIPVPEPKPRPKPAPSEDEPTRVHCPDAAEKIRRTERELCAGMGKLTPSEECAHKPLKVGPCCTPRDTLKEVLVDESAPSEQPKPLKCCHVDGEGTCMKPICPSGAVGIMCTGAPGYSCYEPREDDKPAPSEDDGEKLAERLWTIMRKFGGHPMPTRDWIQVALRFRAECVAELKEVVEAAKMWVWYNGKEDLEVYEVRALCKAVHALPDQGEPPKNKFPWADGHLAKWVAETTAEERREWISRAVESLPDDMRELMNLPEDKPRVSDEESGVRIVVKVLVDADGEVHAGVESAERHPREARPWR